MNTFEIGNNRVGLCKKEACRHSMPLSAETDWVGLYLSSLSEQACKQACLYVNA